jgi:glyoxylase-like metal-dependent hydrolase (beta-lactamase superfamily II)
VVIVKIANGIEMLKLTINVTGTESIIYPTLMWDENTVILVDAGAPGGLNQIKKIIEDLDMPFERLGQIIITHQDIDHIGGIRSILDELPEVEVLAHKADQPYIQGEKNLIRLNSNFMERISNLSDEDKEKVLQMFENASIDVNLTLGDGEKLECCGVITVIHTPGHTPGHICLYHQASKTLIVGDAMNVLDGQLTGPNPQILNEEDLKTALNSLKKFTEFDVENVITYHGGLFTDNPNKRIKELIRGQIDV